MVTAKAATTLRDLILEVLGSANSSEGTPDLGRANRQLSALSRLDYGNALRKHFSRPQMHGLVRDLRSFLPELNRQLFSETDLRRLAAKASTLGAELRPRAFDGEEGRGLRGFYIHDRTILRRPLIVVNTTDHVVSVAAAFWHEMGHHLTHAIFGQPADRVSAYMATGYGEHLAQPDEIAADILTVLAGYPKPAANLLFGGPPRRGRTQPTEVLISRARPYVRSVTGFEFDLQFSKIETLHYLAGMIHMTKLREALLHEYGL